MSAKSGATRRRLSETRVWIVLVVIVALASSQFGGVARADEFRDEPSASDSSVSDSSTDEPGVAERSSCDWVVSDKLASVDSQLQFRVDNVVRFMRNERETKYRSSTVFYDDLVFDFVGDNGEIVVYSFNERKFALIDPIRRMRAEIDEEEIERFLSRVKPILREKNDGFTTFMTEPKFEISEKEDEFFFQSKWIDYHVTTKAFEDAQVSDAYFRFVNALGKLNVYMNPGVVTPLARLEANKEFEKDARFPEKIVTDIYPKGKTIFTKTIKIQNEASLARRLSERDRSRVNRTIHFVAQFPLVNFQTYFEKTAER